MIKNYFVFTKEMGQLLENPEKVTPQRHKVTDSPRPYFQILCRLHK